MFSNQYRTLIIDFALSVTYYRTKIDHLIGNRGFSIDDEKILLFGHFEFPLISVYYIKLRYYVNRGKPLE